MMETELFNRQYIISEKELALDGWKQFLFDNYHVYVHPNLDYVHQDGKHLSVAVLGYLFDYRNTKYTNENIVIIMMNEFDYERLKEEGIFIRDGKSRDSAGVLNTTNTFIEKN